MRVGLCIFSGFKIYPGHGKTAVKADGKAYTFIHKKAERSFNMKRNPREVTWTILYRRKNKKGQDEEMVKKRARRTHKFQRAIVGASLSDIMAKRNMKPEVRKAQREQAIKAAKEKNRAAKQAKAKASAQTKTKAPKQKMKVPKAKTMPKQAPRVGGKR
ncbi:60S ribosomal protein L24-like [Amphibalanus amphitrite]|uniref:60S ribosomal protein L24-like n=1 Tax=Amphibalanus amphitrite TaxID=1232801 RepID=UPI001C91253B|nr:60S ribosomal protein L24-like [Amphibalanus amphitrite]XP_043247239.1 60S ribosomal protein L24-like [Amphibalanus amphitrite]